MNALEIVLLLLGIILFVASFIIPVKQEEATKETREVAKSEIENMVAQKMDDIKSHVDDVVDEAVGYAVEKTERSLERLTTEKIMAVNEYSDTVMQEIHKNHEEVMFLYDMLNDKHTSLKTTVTEANKTVSEVNKSTKEAEAVVNSFQMLKPEHTTEEDIVLVPPAEKVEPEKKVTQKKTTKTTAKRTKSQPKEQPSSEPEISFSNDSEEGSTNNNAKILKLHSQGKSKVAIAKELGLGVGEVKLVIDLYKNM